MLTFVPNPMDDLIAERRAVAQEAEEQAERLEEIAEEIAADETLDPAEREELLRRLREAAEKAKIELSSAMETEINLPFIYGDPQTGPKHLVKSLTRARFEQMIEDILQR